MSRDPESWFIRLLRWRACIACVSRDHESWFIRLLRWSMHGFGLACLLSRDHESWFIRLVRNWDIRVACRVCKTVGHLNTHCIQPIWQACVLAESWSRIMIHSTGSKLTHARCWWALQNSWTPQHCVQPIWQACHANNNFSDFLYVAKKNILLIAAVL